jgi:hypothetical protein
MFCLQEKLRRAEALASERETLTNHLRRTLEQQDLRVKQVSSRSYAATSQCWPAELYRNTSMLFTAYPARGKQVSPASHWM